jgi:hypothetical protein
MKPEYEPFAKVLKESLERAKMGPLEIQSVLVRFITEADRTSPERSLVETCESYSNEDGYKLLLSVAAKSKIELALEKISTEHPYKVLTPREKIQRDIEKIKQNQNALDWEFVLSDQDRKNLTPNQLESVEKAEHQRKNPKPVEIPSCFAATASYKGEKIPMELEVR